MAKKKTLPTILVDTREKIPLNYEDDEAFSEVIYRKLDVGDYTIEGMEDIVAVERKAHVDELFVNFGTAKSSARIFGEGGVADRLMELSHKFVVIEQTWDDALNPEAYYVNRKGINRKSPWMPVAVINKSLLRLMLDYDIHVMFAGLQAQQVIKKILLAAYAKYI